MLRSGLFITLEGSEGSGKSTQLPHLVSFFKSKGVDILSVYEPGCTKVGDDIRDIVHNPKYKNINSRTELLLYLASRAQNTEENIKPHLMKGGVVISDRYLDSTFAYQVYGRGLPKRTTYILNKFATDNLTPDLTIYFSVDPIVGLKRRLNGGQSNCMDHQKITFYKKVIAGYEKIIHENPERFVVIDANKSLENVTSDLINALEKRLEMWLNGK